MKGPNPVPEVRRRTMQAVKSKNTGPEMKVRRLLHSLGYRYRLHSRDLPGCPDLVFPGRRKVIFVHGCFWHGHHCARGARIPKSNTDYWVGKIARNQQRHDLSIKALRKMGWKAYTVWECELKADCLPPRLIRFLEAMAGHALACPSS